MISVGGDWKKIDMNSLYLGSCTKTTPLSLDTSTTVVVFDAHNICRMLNRSTSIR